MNKPSGPEKLPKTARGRQTRDKLLQAAEIEFGNQGFHAASVSGITQQAGVALGTFYTYFESKEEIYRALVGYMSQRVRSWIGERIVDAPDRLSAERKGLQAYLEFVREHPGLYRIITEAELLVKFFSHRTNMHGFIVIFSITPGVDGEFFQFCQHLLGGGGFDIGFRCAAGQHRNTR